MTSQGLVAAEGRLELLAGHIRELIHTTLPRLRGVRVVSGNGGQTFPEDALAQLVLVRVLSILAPKILYMHACGLAG